MGYDEPHADFSLIRTSASGVVPANYTFSNLSTFAARYLSDCDVLWDFGNGTSTSTSYTVYRSFNAGTYTVSLTITDPLERSDTMTKTSCITVP